MGSFAVDSLSYFCHYETPKIVVINSWKISLINRITQMCIISYIIGHNPPLKNLTFYLRYFSYVLVYNKGYQHIYQVDNVAVITKVKGVSVTNYSVDDFQVKRNNDYYNRIWDSVEYVIPPSENGAFFIMTNAIITPNQTQSICDETPDIPAALCNDSCPVGETFRNGNGITTGKCIISTQKPEVKVCQVAAWCPVEINKLPLKNNKVLISGAENYTVLIKNSIQFASLRGKYGRNNILENSNSSYMQSCYYNEKTDPLCPVFQVGDMIKAAGENFSEVASIGAVMAVTITWNCDLDKDFMKHCIPKYSFRRLYEHSLIHPGWNFRFSYTHEFERRTVLKAYGIKFVIEVQGEAGQFQLLPTFQNI
ncbi:hypothetical protein J437_LFUL001443, partial [Ladona fulva]